MAVEGAGQVQRLRRMLTSARVGFRVFDSALLMSDIGPKRVSSVILLTYFIC